MIITIVFIVVMSVIGIMILKFSSASIAYSSRSFMDTRAELILRSATEYAILALQGHKINTSNGCLNSINFTDGDNLFDVNITYHYFVTDCISNPGIWNGCKCSDIQTADTNGSVLVYVTVASKNSNFHIRKVSITLQNP
jgi:type II secretory pathway pseudopilin PulG